MGVPWGAELPLDIPVVRGTSHVEKGQIWHITSIHMDENLNYISPNHVPAPQAKQTDSLSKPLEPAIQICDL